MSWAIPVAPTSSTSSTATSSPTPHAWSPGSSSSCPRTPTPGDSRPVIAIGGGIDLSVKDVLGRGAKRAGAPQDVFQAEVHAIVVLTEMLDIPGLFQG